MPDMCYPNQVSVPNTCQRETVLEKVKKLIDEMGERGVQDARPALCHQKEIQEYCSAFNYHPTISHEVNDCICEGVPQPFTDYYQPVTVDGQLAKPVLPYSAVYKPIKYCPPCERKKPDMDGSLGCYTAGGRRKHNASSSRVFEDRCAGESRCTPSDYPWGRKGYRRQSFSAGGVLGQTCPERNIHSVCTDYQCPPDPTHRHWSPICSNCNYPNACYASCFEHPEYKDWVYKQPSYRFYLQKRWDKPFMMGY